MDREDFVAEWQPMGVLAAAGGGKLYVFGESTARVTI